MPDMQAPKFSLKKAFYHSPLQARGIGWYELYGWYYQHDGLEFGIDTAHHDWYAAFGASPIRLYAGHGWPSTQMTASIVRFARSDIFDGNVLHIYGGIQAGSVDKNMTVQVYPIISDWLPYWTGWVSVDPMAGYLGASLGTFGITTSYGWKTVNTGTPPTYGFLFKCNPEENGKGEMTSFGANKFYMGT